MYRLLKTFLKKHDMLLYAFTRGRQFIYKSFISDYDMVNRLFLKKFGRYPDLDNPQTFAEKMQWLKLYWYDELAVQCADKFLVRDYVSRTIGSEYLNDLIGVYESVDEIRIDDLPNQFVIKGTHGSHFNVICNDKEQLDWKKEIARLRRWSSINYYWQNREWVYRDLKPRFVIESYLNDNSGSSLTDYKFFCFSGKPECCQVIKNRGNNETIDFFDLCWNHLPYSGLRKLPSSDLQIKMPNGYSDMIKMAEQLSKPFPFVRVDFYNIEGRIVFGELTFFPQSGLGEFTPKEYDKELSDKIQLPLKNNGND